MPFLFVYVCDLLETLERPHLEDFPVLPKELERHSHTATKRWFWHHERNLGEFGTNSDAVISMLRPERLFGREYGLDVRSLQQVIARILNLPKGECTKLQKWQSWHGQCHLCDLGTCVSEVMGNLEGVAVPAQGNKVTVDEIDQCLLRIASYNPTSLPAIQAMSRHWRYEDVIDLLRGLYLRLQGREAKWLTRYILKNYGPVRVPDTLEFGDVIKTTVKFFSSSAPLPASREGTKIVRGILRTAPGLPQSRPVKLGAQSAILQQSYKPPMIEKVLHKCPPAAVKTKSPKVLSSRVMEIDSQEDSENSYPIVFARGILKPRTNHNSKGTCFESNLSRERLQQIFPGQGIKVVNVAGNSGSAPQSSVGNTSTHEFLVENSSDFAVRPVLGHLSANTLSPARALPNELLELRSLSRNQGSLLIRTGTGDCRLTSQNCLLERCIFLLSPCISRTSYVLNSLLPWHGLQYITSFEALNSPSFPRHCPVTRKRYRKIILVDSSRTKETSDFLLKVKDLGLQTRVKRGKRDGKGRKWDKEWLEVYDWRLLECVGKVDCGQNVDYDPFKRCWVGVV